MNVAIIIADSNGAFPVPASKGGAVATLVEHLVEGANKDKNDRLTIFSYYDETAVEISYKYGNVNFIWIKRPIVIKVLDKLLFKIFQCLFKNKKSISFATLFSLGWYIFKCSTYLKHMKFDKVIFENNIPLAWIIKLSGYQGDYYYHFHNIPRINARCQSVFKKCKGILCISKYVANELKKEECPIAPLKDEQLQILYNCIDTNLFKPLEYHACREELQRRYNLPYEKKIIVFVGRLSREKGIDVLLKACTKLDRNDYIVLIVGSYIQGVKASDPYEMELRKLSDNLKDKVFFTGYVEQDELPIIYSGSDLAVLPSMWDEPAGLTMVEAISCGVPLITTRSGGIPEYMSNNCSVLLDRDERIVDNLSEEINKKINLTRVSEMTNRGLQRAKELDIDNYYSNFIRIINL